MRRGREARTSSIALRAAIPLDSGGCGSRRLTGKVPLTVTAAELTADGVNDATSTSTATGPVIDILFLGNSYTYYNNLPDLVKQMAGTTGFNVSVDSNTPGGATFADHKVNATTIAKIGARDWDYVVLQNQSQTPSWRPEDVETTSLPNAQALVDMIEANSVTTHVIWFETWAEAYPRQRFWWLYGQPRTPTYES